MPIWVTQSLRFLGLSADSARPNVGALLMLGGFVLLAMGYTPEELDGWVEQATAMAAKAAEFATKTDNLLGGVLLALGWRVGTRQQSVS